MKAVERAAFFRPPRDRRSGARELMDGPIESLAELAANFDDIERANRWFGAARPVLAYVRRIGARTVLDVGCGSADIPRALLRCAASDGRDLRVTGLDRSAQIIAIARARSVEYPNLSFVEGEGVALPFPDGGFDAVTCTLTLHHFEPNDAVRLLAEMRRVAHMSPLVADLRRSLLAYAGAHLFARLSRNRLTRHDAPLSVARAYSPAEALRLAREAGWRRPRVHREPFFRMVLSDA